MGFEICVVNIDNSYLVQDVTPNSGPAFLCGWAPDNEHLLFISDGNSPSSDLNAIDVTNLSLQKLARDFGRLTGADWSPDSKSIIFTVADSKVGTGGLYMMNADGSDLHTISTTQHNLFNPVWSLDGEHLVFVSIDSTNQFNVPTSSLYFIDSDGLNERRLTQAIGNILLLTWLR
jgi:Tol biopolymer transport system component